MIHSIAERMEALGDEAAHARVITYLAEVHVHARQPDAALFALRRIEKVVASCGSPRYRGHAYTVMGRAHSQLGDIADADRCYGTALDLFTDAGPGATGDRETVLKLREELAEAAGGREIENTEI